MSTKTSTKPFSYPNGSFRSRYRSLLEWMKRRTFVVIAVSVRCHCNEGSSSLQRRFIVIAMKVRCARCFVRKFFFIPSVSLRTSANWVPLDAFLLNIGCFFTFFFIHKDFFCTFTPDSCKLKSVCGLRNLSSVAKMTVVHAEPSEASCHTIRRVLGGNSKNHYILEKAFT